MKYLLIPFLIVLISCTPHNYPHKKRHSVSIDPNNTEKYWFADFDSVHTGDTHVPNGYVFADGTSYTYTITDCNKVSVTARILPNLVEKYDGVLDKSVDKLEIIDNEFSYIKRKYTFLIIEYDYTDD